MAGDDAEDLERSGQQTSPNGQDWSTTKQSDTTTPRMEDHCIQPSARGWNMMMMIIEY